MTLEQPGSRFYLGLDLGQARYYSAIAIAERRVERPGTWDRGTYLEHTNTRIIITHLGRIPLRTPYPDVVERVRGLTQPFEGPQARSHHGCHRRRSRGARNARLRPPRLRRIRRHAHRRRTGFGQPGRLPCPPARPGREPPRPPRKEMLHIAVPGDVAGPLRAEFLRWGRRSQHDDLIFAVALACWKDGGQPIPLYSSSPLPLVYPEVRR